MPPSQPRTISQGVLKRLGCASAGEGPLALINDQTAEGRLRKILLIGMTLLLSQALSLRLVLLHRSFDRLHEGHQRSGSQAWDALRATAASDRYS